MIVNLNPSEKHFNASLDVLKLASIATEIQIGRNDDDKQFYSFSEPPPELSAQSEKSLTMVWVRDDGAQEETHEEETVASTKKCHDCAIYKQQLTL